LSPCALLPSSRCPHSLLASPISQAPATFTGPRHRAGEVTPAIMVSAFGLAWIVLSLFGTILPAVIDHRPASLFMALQAARQRWFSLVQHLLVLVILPGSALQFLSLFRQGWQKRYSLPVPMQVASLFGFWLASFCLAAIATVILTRAYREGWPAIPAIASPPPVSQSRPLTNHENTSVTL
jgi:hypothetical protein